MSANRRLAVAAWTEVSRSIGLQLRQRRTDQYPAGPTQFGCGFPMVRTSISKALAIPAVNLKEIILMQTAEFADTSGRMAEFILAARARLLSGRSFPRPSRKPVRKWDRMRMKTT